MLPMIHPPKALLAALVVSSCLAICAVGQDPNNGVQTQVLKNGMRVIVQEDHSIPNVAMYIFYRIGSRNERPGTTGLSHFF